MDPKNIMLSEISQSEKDKYHMTSLMGRVGTEGLNKKEKVLMDVDNSVRIAQGRRIYGD